VRELRVRLFGPFQIALGDQPTCGPVLRKAQELLALVLLAPHRSVRRDVAADSVWPAARPDASRKAMRQALWQLHQAADVSVPTEQRLVLTQGETIRVNPDRRLWLDVADFTGTARIAQASVADVNEDTDLAALERASELYRGPLLAGCDDDWCLVERAHLQDLHLTVLDKLSTGYESRGELGPAIYWALRLLEVEPAHERSHRRLMRLFYRTDDRTRALRQYRRCQWVLEHDLGIQPSARTRALAATIGADTGVVPQQREEIPSVGASLDGLRAELAALRASVDAINARLGRL
jgi:DNA-binding SARP family transcriptional activator